jgi:hypothetical protein
MKKFFDKYINFGRQHDSRIFLVGIVLFGAILRFAGFPARYGFDIDATRDAILTQYAAIHNLWPLIGPISALGSFNFGPWYYYQLILFQHLVPFPASLSIYAPWIYVALTSLAVIVVMFRIGKELISKEFGLALALLTAVSPGQIIAGTGLSNPDLVSLFAALSIWFFIRLLKSKRSSWSALFLGLSIGIGINCHYQMIYFLILPFFSCAFVKKGKIRVLVLSLFGIFLSFIPLIFFNLTHHFQTLSGLMDYYVFGKNKVYVPNRWLTYLFDFWPTFWGYLLGLSSSTGLLLMAGSILTSLILIVKRKITKEFALIFLFFLVCFILLRFFSGERTNYYLIFLHPFIILFTGLFIWQAVRVKFGKIILCFLLLGLVISGLRVAIVHTHPVDSHIEFVGTERFLESYYPNKKFLFFACEGQYKDKVQGMVFLMSNGNRLGELESVKIGFKDSHCKYPESFVENRSAGSSVGAGGTKIFTQVDLSLIGAVDLTPYSIETLNTYGWTHISSEYLYNSLLAL